jgi:hypothetical protein
MDFERDDAKTYLGCAAEARAFAVEADCPKLRLVLEKLATSYEARAAAFESARHHCAS